MTQSVTKINVAMLKKLLVFSMIMFGFGYALVPMYEKFCEVNGINNLLQPDVMYEIKNDSDREVSGQAIHSYSQRNLEKYLKKFECFCFTKQVLKPGEVRRMPVKFIIDPQIPVDVSAVTISYTFFALEPGK